LCAVSSRHAGNAARLGGGSYPPSFVPENSTPPPQKNKNPIAIFGLRGYSIKDNAKGKGVIICEIFTGSNETLQKREHPRTTLQNAGSSF
jgi:hypothetical protein